MVSVPSRGTGGESGFTLHEASPFPNTLPPEVTVIQGWLLAAVQPQPMVDAPTFWEKAPPLIGTEEVTGPLTAKLQASRQEPPGFIGKLSIGGAWLQNREG